MPVVIFSKSYCPHSKRAKHLLTEVYDIVPLPTIVELDELTEKLPLPHDHTHNDDDELPPRPVTMGAKIQELLSELTDRRTVPNIMVGGVESIGGNDAIWEMHNSGLLVDHIRGLVGKRLTRIELRKED